jgi:selenocysteine lyase/cysteine desulfurase
MPHGKWRPEPIARISGPASTLDRGGIVAFNLIDAAGHVIDERDVARAAAASGISIRTGCFCNPGAGEAAWQLTREAVRSAVRARPETVDQYVRLLGLPTSGALRASVSVASDLDDVERFLSFVQATYQDRVVRTGELPPRRDC